MGAGSSVGVGIAWFIVAGVGVGSDVGVGDGVEVGSGVGRVTGNGGLATGVIAVAVSGVVVGRAGSAGT
ncbi:MAG: hypothetical protein ACE5Q6_01130 [Dehalococcoidia bacterium]